MSYGHLVLCRNGSPHHVMHRFSKHLAKGVHICIPCWEGMSEDRRKNWTSLAREVKLEAEI